MTIYVIIGEWYIGRTLVKQSFGAYFDKTKAWTRLRQLAELKLNIDFSIEKLEVTE